MTEQTQPDASVSRETGFERCPKCNLRPQAPGGTVKWCLECRAEYQRNYQNGRTEMAKNKGFREGVKATKELLAREFEQFGGSQFSGDEIAALIRRAPGPKNDEEEQPQTP